MNNIVLTKSYSELPVHKKEILRYAGCKTADEEVEKLLKTCLSEAKDQLKFNVCYAFLSVSVRGNVCDFGTFMIESDDLIKNLTGCEKVVVFAATVGVGIDRLISKYSRISPSKALMFQAIGAERIETLCDRFCDDIKNEVKRNLKPRFSPGYGDVPLSLQKDIFNLIGCEKKIGLTLNDSFLMSPTKSVTAFVGISNGDKIERNNKCEICNNQGCTFRRSDK